MKNKPFYFLFILIVLTVSFSCSNNKNDNVELEQTKEVYQCPMKCEGEKTYDQTGKCPVCNMELEKVEHKENKNDPE